MEPTHCQMTAVAADLYLPLPKTQLPDQPTAIKGKSKCAEPGSRDSTIYFKHAAKINLLIAPVSGDEEVLPPPTQLFTVSLHHPSLRSPRNPQKPSTSQFHVHSFIQKKRLKDSQLDSQFRLREGSSVFCPFSGPASIYAPHVFSFSRMTKYRLHRTRPLTLHQLLGCISAYEVLFAQVELNFPRETGHFLCFSFIHQYIYIFL